MISEDRLQREWQAFRRLSVVDKIVLIVIGAALFKIVWWALGTGGCCGTFYNDRD